MKFSIVTPCLNHSAYLPECVESVRKQVGQETGVREVDSPPPTPDSFSVEHLIQDGSSTDGSVALLGAWTQAGIIEADSRSPTPDSFPGRYAFRFASEPDRGQTDAINRGLAKATGDILSYLCADDYLEPGALARVAHVFQEQPEVDVVHGDYAFLEGDSGWKRRKIVGPFSKKRLERDNFLSQPATFWRRRVYERWGGFDESLRYCMDHEYWLRIAGGTVWHYVPEVLAVQRLHGDSKTGSQLVKAWDETAVMAERYGLGPRFRRKARAMRLYGAGLYAAKRRWFHFLGRWMR